MSNMLSEDIGQEWCDFTHHIRIDPPWDKRHKDPDKDCGIGRMTIHFAVERNDCAMSVGFAIPVYATSVPEDVVNGWGLAPFTLGLWYHSPIRRYEHECVHEKCEFIGGCDCYSDGSFLAAEPLCDLWRAKGTDALFEELENEWHKRFSEEEEND